MIKKLLLSALLLCGSFAFGAASRVEGDPVLANLGAGLRPVPHAHIRICANSPSDCSVLASVCPDTTGAGCSTTLATFDTDLYGNWHFYAVPSKYHIQISAPAIGTRDFPDFIVDCDPDVNCGGGGGGGGITGSGTTHQVGVWTGASTQGGVGPGTSGLPLVSGGAAADPTYSVLPIIGGGTGGTTSIQSLINLLPARSLPTQNWFLRGEFSLNPRWAPSSLSSFYDVTDPLFNAKGDARQNGRCSFAANTGAFFCNTSSGRAFFVAGRDEGKVLSIWSAELPLRPTLPAASVATGAGCTASAGTLGDATKDSYVYYVIEYLNPGNSHLSLPSYEGFVQIPAGTTGACVKITSPVAVPVGYKVDGVQDSTLYTDYRVWAVKEVVDTTTSWPGKASGTEYTTNSLQNDHGGASHLTIGSNFQIDSITAGAGNPSNRTTPTFRGTILSVSDASNAVANANISTVKVDCPSGLCEMAAWGTDDTAAIQAAVNQVYTSNTSEPSGRGATIYFPGAALGQSSTGAYLVTSSILVPGQSGAGTCVGDGNTTSSCGAFFRFMGSSGFGSFTLDADNGTNPMGSSQLVTVDAVTVLTVGTNNFGATGNQINGGFVLQNLGFKDLSGACKALGGVKFFDVSRAKLTGLAFGDFCNGDFETLTDGMSVQKGFGIRFDSGCITGSPNGCNDSSPFNNFNDLDSITFINDENPVQFVNGKQSENRVRWMEAVATQFGGGKGVTIDSGFPSGLSNSGGNNSITESTFAYFPVGYYLNNQNTGKLDQARGESTSSTQPHISGGGSFGTQTVLQGDNATSFCKGLDVVNGTAGGYALGLWLSPNCVGISLFGNTATSGAIPMVFNGTGTSGFIQRGTSGTSSEIYLQDTASGNYAKIKSPGTITTPWEASLPVADSLGCLKTDGLSDVTTSTPSQWSWTPCLSTVLTTSGDIIYSSGGSTPARLAAPTTPNSVPQILTSTPSGVSGQPPAWALPGVAINPQTGATYTVAVTDRASYLSFSNAGAIAVTLPQAGGAGFASNFVFVACAIGAGTATITPTTSTISFSTGAGYTAAAANMALTTGQCAWVYSDNTNYFAIRR